MKNSRISQIFALLLLLSLGIPVQSQTIGSLDDRTRRNYANLAQSFEQAGQIEQAARYYREILLSDPSDRVSYNSAKRLLLQLNRDDEWRDLLQKLQGMSRDVRYEIDLADIRYRQGERDKALRHWQTILDDHAKNHQVYDLIASVLSEHELYEEAIGVYLRARKEFKNNDLYIFELAHLFSMRGKWPEVVHEYMTFLRRNPRQLAFIESRLLDLSRSDADVGKAIASGLEEFGKGKDELPDLFRILAAIHQQRSEFQSAMEAYLRHLFALPKSEQTQAAPLLLSFARTSAQAEEVQIAQRVYQELASAFPGSPFSLQAQLGLAELYVHQHLYSQAVEALTQFARRFPRSREAAQALIEAGDIELNQFFAVDRARELYREALQLSPLKAERILIHHRLGLCAVAAGDLTMAETEIEKILKIPGEKENNLALLERARIELYRGRPKEVEKRLDPILSGSNLADPWVNDGLEILMLMQRIDFDSASIAVYGAAEFLQRQGEHDKALAWIEDKEEDHPQLKEDLIRLKVSSFIHLTKYDAALAVLEEIAETDGIHREWALKMMGYLYTEKLQRYEQAQEVYDRFLIRYPKSIYIEEIRGELRRIKEHMR
ncbi:tetratricopeptide repeat protein [candidate division KSB1 bacterium]|nr:tetratricopeptide repeat protein [candidate division KSB1 bacterium]